MGGKRPSAHGAHLPLAPVPEQPEPLGPRAHGPRHVHAPPGLPIPLGAVDARPLGHHVAGVPVRHATELQAHELRHHRVVAEDGVERLLQVCQESRDVRPAVALRERLELGVVVQQGPDHRHVAHREPPAPPRHLRGRVEHDVVVQQARGVRGQDRPRHGGYRGRDGLPDRRLLPVLGYDLPFELEAPLAGGRLSLTAQGASGLSVLPHAPVVELGELAPAHAEGGRRHVGGQGGQGVLGGHPVSGHGLRLHLPLGYRGLPVAGEERVLLPALGGRRARVRHEQHVVGHGGELRPARARVVGERVLDGPPAGLGVGLLEIENIGQSMPPFTRTRGDYTPSTETSCRSISRYERRPDKRSLTNAWSTLSDASIVAHIASTTTCLSSSGRSLTGPRRHPLAGSTVPNASRSGRVTGMPRRRKSSSGKRTSPRTRMAWQSDRNTMSCKRLADIGKR